MLIHLARDTFKFIGSSTEGWRKALKNIAIRSKKSVFQGISTDQHWSTVLLSSTRGDPEEPCKFGEVDVLFIGSATFIILEIVRLGWENNLSQQDPLQ